MLQLIVLVAVLWLQPHCVLVALTLCYSHTMVHVALVLLQPYHGACGIGTVTATLCVLVALTLCYSHIIGAWCISTVTATP